MTFLEGACSTTCFKEDTQATITILFRTLLRYFALIYAFVNTIYFCGKSYFLCCSIRTHMCIRVIMLFSSALQASQLLFTLLYHLEEHATHHIHAIINGLYKACQDEDSNVVEQVCNTSSIQCIVGKWERSNLSWKRVE